MKVMSSILWFDKKLKDNLLRMLQPILWSSLFDLFSIFCFRHLWIITCFWLVILRLIEFIYFLSWYQFGDIGLRSQVKIFENFWESSFYFCRVVSDETAKMTDFCPRFCWKSYHCSPTRAIKKSSRVFFDKLTKWAAFFRLRFPT